VHQLIRIDVSLQWTTLISPQYVPSRRVSAAHLVIGLLESTPQTGTPSVQTFCTAAPVRPTHRQTDRQLIWHDASRSQWQEYAIGEIFNIFPSGTESMGDTGPKKAYTGLRTGIYLPTKFGCDRSIVVSCRSRNDRQTSRQTEWNDNKAHSLRT